MRMRRANVGRFAGLRLSWLAGIFILGTVEPAMKMLTEYLERAVNLERLAAGEQDSTFKAELLNQAKAYRKLAARRAEQYGLPSPSPPDVPNSGVT
jgi:hypothetical protein